MSTLKKEQLITLKKEISAVISKSSAKTARLVGTGEMKKDDQLKINSKLTEVQGIFDDLNFELLKEVVKTELREPGGEIKIATDKVNAAVDKLKTVDDFIGFSAALINIGNTIIGAFSTGNPLKLTDLLDQIKAIA